MVSKKCTKCKKAKLPEDFYREKCSRDGRRSSCKMCDNIRVKEYRRRNREACRKSHRKWRAKNPKKVKQSAKKSYRRNIKNRRNYNLKKLCGITLDEYDCIFEQQNGVCAICGKVEMQKNQYGIRRLSADHNHATGKMRGLLCNNCNRFIGFCEESVEILEKTIRYLEMYK